MRKIKYTFAVVLCLMTLQSTQTWSGEGNAGYPGEFLRYGVGPRALGTGGAFTALADDASAVYWNPAGLMTVQQTELTSMYSNLFYDTRYTFMGAALPRVIDQNTSVGLGWVNLAMTGFDQRDVHNRNMGSFDVYEQAFMLSVAREYVSTWGIVNYGVNFNLVNQAFPNYTSDQGWGFGTDVGATVKLINPFLLKLPLKYLLPLQFGISLKNIITPRVGFSENQKDEFPFSLRTGLSYRFTFDQWVLNTLYDYESIGTDHGHLNNHYGGFEAVFPWNNKGIVPKLRAGYNTKSQAPSFGAGLAFDATDNVKLNVDMAFALKPTDVLKNDIRLFLTLDFGTRYDDEFFLEQLTAEKEKYLQILARYPNDHVEIAAENLGTTLDSKNATRYFRLIGGLSLANELYTSVRAAVENNRFSKAGESAGMAVQEYELALEKQSVKFTEQDIRRYSECAMISGDYLKSTEQLQRIENPDYKSLYLLGTVYFIQGRHDLAVSHLQQSVDKNPNNLESLKALSLFLQGSVYFDNGEFEKAVVQLNQVTNQFNVQLNRYYSRFTFFNNPELDAVRLSDDAEFLIAQCYEKLGMEKEALNAYYNIQRYYPASNLVDESVEQIEKLLGRITQ
ncbi:MAG: tetratricopeptide repeat protein [candidate division KSB1 bacterium]|nr:tetratricopeptide repeat protein [candidate division KSB1 bacterium]